MTPSQRRQKEAVRKFKASSVNSGHYFHLVIQHFMHFAEWQLCMSVPLYFWENTAAASTRELFKFENMNSVLDLMIEKGIIALQNT